MRTCKNILAAAAIAVTGLCSTTDAVAQTVELEARIDGKHAELLAGMSGIARFPGLQ